MKNWTILRAASLAYILYVCINTVVQWDMLSGGEGWGVVAMVTLFFLGLAGLVLDAILRFVIGNRKWVNIIGAIILIGVVIVFYRG